MKETAGNADEIIARKKAIGWLYILTLILGISSIIVGVCTINLLDVTAIMLIVVGIILAIVSIILCLKIRNTPDIVITRIGDTLILPCGEYKISQVNNVIVRRARARGFMYKWGKIILTINGAEYKYNFVADVEDVQKRLTELMLENKNSEQN